MEEKYRKSLINDIQDERRKLMENVQRRKEDLKREQETFKRKKKNEMERMQHLRKVIKQERDELEREKEAFAQKRSAVESDRRKLKLQSQEMEDAHCKLMEQVQRERDKALEIKVRDFEMVIRQRHKLMSFPRHLSEEHSDDVPMPNSIRVLFVGHRRNRTVRTRPEVRRYVRMYLNLFSCTSICFLSAFMIFVRINIDIFSD